MEHRPFSFITLGRRERGENKISSLLLLPIVFFSTLQGVSLFWPGAPSLRAGGVSGPSIESYWSHRWYQETLPYGGTYAGEGPLILSRYEKNKDQIVSQDQVLKKKDGAWKAQVMGGLPPACSALLAVQALDEGRGSR